MCKNCTNIYVLEKKQESHKYQCERYLLVASVLFYQLRAF